jgi:hypothetical protein
VTRAGARGGLLHRLIALLLTCSALLGAQGRIDWSKKPVVLLTMGQGEQVFEKFGHNAIVVFDEATGQPMAYNWGVFDFQQPNFIGRFLSGDTKYWMRPDPLGPTLELYAQLGRSVIAQELLLTPSQKTRLVAALAENAKEANKYYRYDYYRDNCSTRARDAIDAVTGGAVRRAMDAMPGTGSYRWHTRRLLGYSAPLYFGIQVVLGVDADAPLTMWQQAFLPQSLSDGLTRVELPAADGLPTRLIVGSVDTLVRATRPPEPAQPDSHLLMAAVIGVGIGMAVTLLARIGRISAACAVALWSLLSATVGVALLLAWFATQHVFMRSNPSVALLNPAWFLGLVTAIGVARGRLAGIWRSAPVWLLLIGAVGVLGAVLAGHAQSALELGALVLPGHAAVAYIAQQVSRRTR